MRKLKNEELGRLSEADFKQAEKNPVCLVLDNIRSMNNVGSVFRTSDAFLVEKVYLCGITATPPHREIQKTALGATETVAWEYAEDILSLCETLRKTGWKVVAVEQADKSVSLDAYKPHPDEKIAFVFGNEVFGVNEELVRSADMVLEIPQFGTKHSLNIAVSAGVVLWHYIYKVNCPS